MSHYFKKIMKPSSIFTIISFTLIFLLLSCAHYALYPIPKSGLEAKGNKLFYKENPDKVFAELRYKKAMPTGVFYALKLYFFDSQKELWIFPEGGQIELDRNMTQKIRPVVTNVRFSEDGKYVLYDEPGFMIDSKRKFSIETGIIK